MAIIQEAGRSYSVRQIDELRAALKHELDLLTPEERQMVELILAEQQMTLQGRMAPGLPSLLATVERVEWREQPVDMRTFVFDEYYLGKTCDGLYDTHFHDMEELFDRGGYHQAIWTGAIGCLRGDTLIHDPVEGDTLTVAERFRLGDEFHVWALSSDGPVIAPARPPMRFEAAPMVRVILEGGEEVVVTPGHQFWTGRSWVTASEVARRLQGSEPVLLASSSDIDPSAHGRGAPHSSRRVPDSRAGCPRGLRSDDGQPLVVSAPARAGSPSPVDAPGYIRDCLRADALAGTAGHSRIYPPSGRPSRPRSSPGVARAAASFLRELESLLLRDCGWRSGPSQSPAVSALLRRVRALASSVLESIAGPGWTRDPLANSGSTWRPGYHNGSECNGSGLAGLVRVLAVEPCAPEPYYDFNVPTFHNYRAGGLWHHNTGKSFSASIGMCRIVYELSCMVDPHGAFHIARNSPIHLVCFSVTEDLAVKVAFDNIIEKIQASPYFREKFPFKAGKKEFRFPKKISLAARATTDTSALGMNVIAAWIDEGNFLPKPGKAMKMAGEKDKGEKIYNQLLRRMKSRFERRGKLPGMMFVVSSKRRTDDFTDKLIRQSKGDRTVFVRDYSLWDVKPENYSKETFWVFVGNETLPSSILLPEQLPEYQRIAKENDNCVLIEVPEDFRLDFERDLEDAIRDIAGISTVTIAPFIQRRDRIKAAADYGEKHGLFHPFSVMEYTPGRTDGHFLWDRMVEHVQRPTVEGGYELLQQPRLNPAAPRHIHIDPSLTGDATGFVMAHIAGYKEVVRRDDAKREYAELAPVFLVDVALPILPPLGDEILLGDVRALVYQLQDHGYPIVFLSQDGHQSADTLQQMPQRGIAAERVSVDIKPDAYEVLKTALYEGRVIYYHHPRLLRELSHLEKNHMTGKVDHPPQGSKDMADALAGAVYTLSQKQPQRRGHLPMMRGLSYTPTLGSSLPMQPPSMDPAARSEVPAPTPTVVSRAPLGMVSGDEDDGWQEAY